MRRLIRTFAAVILTGVLPGMVGAQAPDPYAAAREAMRQAVDTNKVPSISVAVFRNGKIDWEESYGWADREHGVKATPRTIYSLASISKSFTATGLMTLVAEGKVKLDRPVNDYLGSVKIQARIGNAADATVGRVANHTAGLPFHAQFFYADTPYKRPSEDETIRKYGQLISRPGEQYWYSNLGFGILDEVITRQSGTPYARYMKQAVFEPLGLKETSVGPPTSKSAVTAVRYTLDGKVLPYYVTDHAGASEVYSSAHDLIRFAAFHLKAHLPEQKPILSDAAIDAMHVNTAQPGADEGYGIGFETGIRGAYATVSHGGSMPGSSTEMLMVPSKGVAIVVLTNTWPSGVSTEVADRIAAAVLPGWVSHPPHSTTPVKFTPPAALVGQWVGHVVREEGDLPVVLTINSNGSAVATIGNQAPVTLQDASFAGGRLGGLLDTSLQTQDSARYNYKVRLNMKLEGERLYGEATALDSFSHATFAAALTHWIDLKRKP